jgi:hypothetical protein
VTPAPRQLPMPLRPRAAAPAAAGPATYVPLPRRLVEDLRHSPAAVGVAVLLGRLFLIAGEAVPLSPSDLKAYDPALSRESARRALKRLVDAGYALATGEGGLKHSYRPAWGRVNGVPLPWDREATSLGRPRHIPAVRVDDRLLDLCIGRIRLSQAHRAIVERYVAAPLLSLRDIGVYALALAGVPARSPALARLGLQGPDGQALPLPDDRAILAVASQRAAGEQSAHGGLTAAGWRHMGFTPPAPSAPSDEPLFFVPLPMVGGVIAPMVGGMVGGGVGQPPMGDGAQTASESHVSPLAAPRPGSHGSTESNGTTTTGTSCSTHSTARCGGGDIQILPTGQPDSRAARPAHIPVEHRPRRATPMAQTPPAQTSGVSDEPNTAPQAQPVSPEFKENMRLLREIGVRADVAATLATRSTAQISRTIDQARARRGVRDLAGWVVSTLRAFPDTPPDPVDNRPISVVVVHRYPGLTDEQRDLWITRFHAAETPAAKRAVVARLEREHPIERRPEQERPPEGRAKQEQPPDDCSEEQRRLSVEEFKRCMERVRAAEAAATRPARRPHFKWALPNDAGPEQERPPDAQPE